MYSRVMRPAAALAVLAALTAACRGSDEQPAAERPVPAPVPARAHDAGPVLPPHAVYATARAALEAVLAKSRPVVLGVGEVHVLTGGPKVRSALARFTEDLDVLKASATDLVVETWVTDGRCGAAETEATTAVRADT